MTAFAAFETAFTSVLELLKFSWQERKAAFDSDILTFDSAFTTTLYEVTGPRDKKGMSVRATLGCSADDHART